MLNPFFTFMNFYIFYVGNFFNFNFILFTQISTFIILYIIFFIIIYNKKKIYKSFTFNLFYNIYNTMYDIILSSVGNNGIIFFPFLFFFWLFIFYFNLIGLFPFAFTIGSHFTVTICFSIIAWMGSLILLVESETVKYFDHFYIENINFYLATFISFIELISYTFRAISLALRLFANLVAGHVLLHLCGALVVSSLFWTNPFNILYIIQFKLLMVVISFLFSFELIVSFIQSYVFLLLTCIYLQDTLNLYNKNKFYYSHNKMRARAYILYTIDYKKRCNSILFNDFFSNEKIKYRFIGRNDKYRQDANTIYAYYKQESNINDTLYIPHKKYNMYPTLLINN